jgi:hypothetical protein
MFLCALSKCKDVDLFDRALKTLKEEYVAGYIDSIKLGKKFLTAVAQQQAKSWACDV